MVAADLFKEKGDLVKVTYDPSLTDDEWREINFDQTDIASSRVCNVPQPTAAELLKAAKRFGPEGILDTAIHLSQNDYRKVEAALKEKR